MPRRLHALIFILLICALTVAGCGGPRFVPHDPPALPALHGGLVALADAECPAGEAYPQRPCDPDGRLAALGCDAISLPDPLLAGLEPARPLLRCDIHPQTHGEEAALVIRELEDTRAYILRGGGLLPWYARYVIDDVSGLRVLATDAELAASFAPVGSTEEALSMALGVTGFTAEFGLARDPDLAYEGDTIEDTHVVETEDGYRVLLYQTQVFGCGPHWTDAVWVSVGRDGAVSEEGRAHAWRDPEQDGLCVD